MTTTSIKFFWNGIKLNGSRELIKCFYSLDNNCEHSPSVSIYAKGYGAELPRDVFVVSNDTDIMTDYFDTDSATLTPAHPLYKYARAAALKAEIRHAEKHLSYCESRAVPGLWMADYYAGEAEHCRDRLNSYRAELDHLPTGQPTAADLAAVEAMNLAAETERIAREHAEQIAAREKYLAARHDGRVFIEQQMQKFPIEQGAPVVRIQWSESPAFASWGENELVLSVAAAETILAHYDAEKAAEEGGYNKTKFLIEYAGENGEPCTYEGRYDLGDDEGGLIAHIRNFGAGGYGLTDEERAEYAAFADMLYSYTEAGSLAAYAEHVRQEVAQEAAAAGMTVEEYAANGYESAQIVSVTLAPWVENYYTAKLQQAEQATREIMETAELFTDDQLRRAVMMVDPNDPEQIDVARFFLQILEERDHAKALEVFREWRQGGAA